MDQPTHAICSAMTPARNPRPDAVPWIKSGHTSRRMPQKPTTSPAIVRSVSFSPSGRNASTPAIQNGEAATITAASQPAWHVLFRPHPAAVAEHEQRDAEKDDAAPGARRGQALAAGEQVAAKERPRD